MLFMGEEYGESAPFPFFTNHSDGRLIDSVRRGRKQGFASFGWPNEPPDPQDESTFRGAKLRVEQSRHGQGKTLHDWHRAVLHLRRGNPILAKPERKSMEVHVVEESELLCVRRWGSAGQVLLVFHFCTRPARVGVHFAAGTWRKVLDSSEESWQGPGTQLPGELHAQGELELLLAPRSVAIYSG
jgi:maltooligosyltrehalose trehalohydrolase